jgi:hypothetical protein
MIVIAEVGPYVMLNLCLDYRHKSTISGRFTLCLRDEGNNDILIPNLRQRDIERMGRHLLRIAEAIAAKPEPSAPPQSEPHAD